MTKYIDEAGAIELLRRCAVDPHREGGAGPTALRHGYQRLEGCIAPARAGHGRGHRNARGEGRSDLQEDREHGAKQASCELTEQSEEIRSGERCQMNQWSIRVTSRFIANSSSKPTANSCGKRSPHGHRMV